MQFNYARPTSVQQACDMLEEQKEATLLAGGQSLLPLLREKAVSYDYVIDITQLSEREYIRLEDDQIRIGCLTRHVEVVESETVRKHCPVLAEAVGQIGDLQVRNRGTICGSLAHADPSGDPPLIAVLLNAEIHTRSPDETTTYSARSFYTDAHSTELDRNEIITEARFPVIDSDQGVAYNKWHPSEVAYAVASAGVSVEIEESHITDATIVTGAIEPTPKLRPSVANQLIGAQPTEQTLNQAAIAVAEDCDPVEDFEGSKLFKREMIKTLVKKSLTEAVEKVK